MFFVGRILPPPKPTTPEPAATPPQRRPANDFSERHALEMNLANHPLYDNHKWDKPVGKILYSYTNKLDNTKHIWGRINPEEEELRSRVRRGDVRELSLTHFFSMHFNEDGTKVQSRIPLEVSLTKKGNRPNCDIIHYFEQEDLPKNELLTNSKMSQAPPSTSATQDFSSSSSAPGAGAAPAPSQQAASADGSLEAFDSMDTDAIVDSLKKSGMTGDEAFRRMVEALQKLGQTDIAAEQISNRAKQLEAEKQAQTEQATQKWLANLQKMKVTVPPDVKRIQEHMSQLSNTQPQLFQEILANDETAASHITSLESRIAQYEERESKRREKKGLPPSRGTALDWVNHRLSSASASSKASYDSSASGIFRNSFLTEVATGTTNAVQGAKRTYSAPIIEETEVTPARLAPGEFGKGLFSVS
jgi:hypothetical protein